MMKNEKEMKAMMIESIDDSLVPNKVAEIKTTFAEKSVKPARTRKPLFAALSTVLSACALTGVIVYALKDREPANNTDKVLDKQAEVMKENTDKIGFGVSSAVSAVNALNGNTDDANKSLVSRKAPGYGRDGEGDGYNDGNNYDDGYGYGGDHNDYGHDYDDYGHGGGDYGPGGYYGGGDHHGGGSHEGEQGWGHGWHDGSYQEEDGIDDADALIKVLNPYLPSIANKVYDKAIDFEVLASDDPEYQYMINGFYFSLVEDEIEEIVTDEDIEEEVDEVVNDDPQTEEKIYRGRRDGEPAGDGDPEIIDEGEPEVINDGEPEVIDDGEPEVSEEEEEDVFKEVLFSIEGKLVTGEDTSIEAYGEYYTASYGDDSLECLDLYFVYSEDTILVVSQFKYNTTYYVRNFSNTYYDYDHKDEINEEELDEINVSYESLSFANYVKVTKTKHHSDEVYEYFKQDSYIEFDELKYNDDRELYASISSSVELDEKTYELTADLSFYADEDVEAEDAVRARYNMFINSTESDSYDIHGHGCDFGPMFGFGWGFDSMKGRRSHGEFTFAKNAEGAYEQVSVSAQGGEEVDDSEEGFEDDFYDWFDPYYC